MTQFRNQNSGLKYFEMIPKVSKLRACKKCGHVNDVMKLEKCKKCNHKFN